MAKPGFYNDGRNRAFPFLKGTVGDRLAAVTTVEGLPDEIIVDAGFVMGLHAGFIDGTHTVWLDRIVRADSIVYFQFKSDAPGLFNRTLTFTRAIGDPDYVTEHVEDFTIAASASSESSTACSQVLQLGISGSFVAQCTGRLRLFFNDDYRGDNSGAYVVTISGTPYTVPATAASGVDGPNVVAGVTYNYTATGTIIWRITPLRHSDADGPTEAAAAIAGDGFAVPGLQKWSLVATLNGHKSSPVEEPCDPEPLWSGYLVTGRLSLLTSILPTTISELARAFGGVVEPALVQNLAGSYVGTINLVNDDRTRVDAPSGCPAVEWPYVTGDDVVYINARCLQGHIRVKAGYNAVIRQSNDDNSIVISAEVGAGEGTPCEEVELFAGEVPAAGSALLEGGPRCNDVIRSLNGIGGQFASILGGTGVVISELPLEHTILADVNMNQLAICFSDSGFSAFSETL